MATGTKTTNDTSPARTDGTRSSGILPISPDDPRRTGEWIEGLNRLQERLLARQDLSSRLRCVTDGIVSIFNADFARIWIIQPGDRCRSGCVHAVATDERHICRDRDRCLHLTASSGRYTHLDGGTRSRVPFGCYKIGEVAEAEAPKLITNDVMRDPRIHDHDWARELGLVSFAGYRLLSPEGEPIGILGLFGRHPISSQEDALLELVAHMTSQAIVTDRAEAELRLTQRSIDAAASSIFWLKADAGFVYVNDAACRNLGYSRDELLTMGVPDVDRYHDHTAWPGAWADLKKSKVAVFESIHVHKDGSSHPVEIVTNYLDFEGEEYLFVFATDITERKDAETRLNESKRDIEKFNRLAVGREMKMIELKKEVNGLAKRLGMDPPYPDRPR